MAKTKKSSWCNIFQIRLPNGTHTFDGEAADLVREWYHEAKETGNYKQFAEDVSWLEGCIAEDRESEEDD